ncbi:MAG: GIY-YIG nuclease family protein [Bacteroidetes bacterium]|nr:GIY-YIG nuclease family protein [Bacteroidota bacterium]
MNFTVYSLFSKSTQKYYTGSTQDLANRLLEHNNGETRSIQIWNSLGSSLAN